MGDFFSKFKKSLDKGVNTVSIKSNTLVEINKVKSSITALRNTVQVKKIEMANNFYTMYLEEAIDLEKCIFICEEIKDLEKEIKNKEIEIENIKMKEGSLLAEANKPEEVRRHTVITPNVVVVEEELSEETVQIIDEGIIEDTMPVSEGPIEDVIKEVSVKICECGSILQEDMKFCVQCGKKIEW